VRLGAWLGFARCVSVAAGACYGSHRMRAAAPACPTPGSSCPADQRHTRLPQLPAGVRQVLKRYPLHKCGHEEHCSAADCLLEQLGELCCMAEWGGWGGVGGCCCCQHCPAAAGRLAVSTVHPH
jgi:hypothetical protein